jgi:hypothetical protein
MLNAKSVQEIIDSLEKFNLDNVKEITDEDYPIFTNYLNKASLDIFVKFIELSLKASKDNINKFDNLFDEIEKITHIYSNRVFLFGYRFGIKDLNNNPDFSDEFIKNLAGEKLYNHIKNTNKLISSYIYLEFIYTSCQVIRKEKKGLTREDFVREIEKIMGNYMAQIFMAGYMTGEIKENIKSKNEGLGTSI